MSHIDVHVYDSCMCMYNVTYKWLVLVWLEIDESE